MINYSPPRPKRVSDPNLPLIFLRSIYNDEKRRNGKEREMSNRLSGVLTSDKISDDNFCKVVLPKIIEQYANEVEKNSKLFQADLKAIENYELWHCTSWQWSHEI